MKLSKKGQIKIGESLCIFGRSLAGSRATALAQLAFEPDDFDDVVVLTRKEAKKLQKEFLDVVSDVARASGYHKVMLPKPDSFAMLEGRIEQAEKNHGT